MTNAFQRDGLNRNKNIFRRETIIRVLRAALESGEYRYARQAALTWLAAFPGDLEVTLLQAQAVLAEDRVQLALPSLELLCRKDPFYLDAYHTLIRIYQKTDSERCVQASSAAYVIEGVAAQGCQLAPWGEPLRAAYQALAARQFIEADGLIQQAMSLEPDSLLAAVLQLQVQKETQQLQAAFHLAKFYHDRWPDCLPISLIFAETCLELGNEPESVRLLHLCVANDSTGQTARRLWGPDHPYRSLWPEDMAILFEHPVPAGVAACLGWNQLAPGEIVVPVEPVFEAEPLAKWAQIDAILEDDACDQLEVQSSEPEAQKEDAEVEVELPQIAPEVAESSAPVENAVVEETPAETAEKPDRPSAPRQSPRKGAEDTLRKVQIEFERLAKKLNQPALSRTDGRYPVYIILSTREGLVEKYGPQTAKIIENELNQLAGLVNRRAGWGAKVYFPDDAAQSSLYGLTPVNPRDPWKIKHALADLDAALSKKGEMIGALFIVGDEQVVPFHRLPNPTDDFDGEVPSDSPYAALGANYFIPEWPVGRLPGEAGPDAGLLLDQLRLIQRFHSRRAKGKFSPGMDLWIWLKSMFQRLVPDRTMPSFGMTAAVWRRSSLAVFRPIGAPHTVVASPPACSGNYNPERMTSSSLAYYNLHGLEDSPAWYGQRDPFEPDDVPDYPVALIPEDLKRNGRSPRFVFSEACYGGHIAGKTDADSLALKFLSMGTSGVVASTCVSYGSVSMPLIAADLLGYLFWYHMKAGRTAGEALLQAKIDLVQEMDKRQGYLDGEDQKTLISFVLYGDPLATYEGFRVRLKSIYRSKEQYGVKTISDHAEENAEPPTVSPLVMKQVKQIVAQYLPGVEMADVRFCLLPANGDANTHQGNEKGSRRKNGTGSSERLVVTASKQVASAQHIHRHYVRFTLDEKGKTLKLSISR
jgi:tetratricopeptide (TPR) repeat protein